MEIENELAKIEEKLKVLKHFLPDNPDVTKIECDFLELKKHVSDLKALNEKSLTYRWVA